VRLDVARLWRELRPFRLPAFLVAFYVAVRLLLLLEPLRRGFLAPGGAVNLPMVAFGLGVIALRGAVLFLVPALVAYRVIRRMNGRGCWPVTPSGGTKR
jgi:hypothetical protein